MKENKVFFTASVGSVNYNLETENSDKDYKTFIIPSFHDIYSNCTISKSKTSEEVDIEVKDVRVLVDLWHRSNVNFIEVLFAKELVWDKEDSSVHKAMSQLLEWREDIARMNIPYLLNSSLGMSKNKMKEAKRATDPEKAGKAFMSAYRILDFFIRYEKSGFQHFADAIRYTDKEREELLKFRNGTYTHYEMVKMVEEKEEAVLAFKTIDGLSRLNAFVIPGFKVKEDVHTVIYDLVREHVFQ